MSSLDTSIDGAVVSSADTVSRKKKDKQMSEVSAVTIASSAPTAKPIDYSSIESVPWDLPVSHLDDPGIFFEYAGDSAIHNVLNNNSVLPAGLVQGVDAAASRANLQSWVVAQFSAVVPHCQVSLFGGGFSNVAFHHISFVQFIAIMNRLKHFEWSVYCTDNNCTAGKIFTVTNGGVGSNETTNIREGPFV